MTATTATDDDEVQDGSAAVYIVAGVMGFLVIALLVVSFFYFRSRSKTGGDKLFARSSTRRALDSTPSRRVSSVGAKSPKLMRRGSAVMRSDRVKASSKPLSQRHPMKAVSRSQLKRWGRRRLSERTSAAEIVEFDG